MSTIKDCRRALIHLWQQSKKRVGIIAAITTFVIAVWLVYWVPQYQVAKLRERIENPQKKLDDKQIKLEQDYVDYANKTRTTLAQIIGGVGLLLGLYMTWRTVRVTEEGKLTERYSKAVELLGNDKLDVRIGAIYALERIARDSQKDHWTVMEVLTAFIKENAKAPSPTPTTASIESRGSTGTTNVTPTPTSASDGIATDIQAALTVIGRRKWREQEKYHQRLDLKKAFLPKADLWDAHLERAVLWDVNLEGADLSTTNLEGAKLSCAHLEGTDLLSVTGLKLPQLIYADMEGKPIKLSPDLDAGWDEEKKRRDEEKAKDTPDKTA